MGFGGLVRTNPVGWLLSACGGLLAVLHACSYDWPPPGASGSGGQGAQHDGGGGAQTGGAGAQVGGGGAQTGGGGIQNGGASGSGGIAGGSGGVGNAGVTPSGLAIADQNDNLLEPNEQAEIKPSWTLASQPPQLAETGSATLGDNSKVTLSPSTATYSLSANQAKACSSCYGVSTQSRPTQHWDLDLQETLATTGAQHSWVVHVGSSFTDMPTNATGYRESETLLHIGFDTALNLCGLANSFCPTTSVRRDEIAVWVAVALTGSDAKVPLSGSIGGVNYDCTNGPTYYADVAPSNPACRHIHYLSSLGVAVGTTPPDAGPSTYNPTTTSSRQGTAVFVARALAVVKLGLAGPPTSGKSYDCAAGNSPFSDVSASSPFCPAIGYLNETLSTQSVSCGANTFCPGTDTTRVSAAIWLVRMLNLELYGP